MDPWEEYEETTPWKEYSKGTGTIEPPEDKPADWIEGLDNLIKSGAAAVKRLATKTGMGGLLGGLVTSPSAIVRPLIKESTKEEAAANIYSPQAVASYEEKAKHDPVLTGMDVKLGRLYKPPKGPGGYIPKTPEEEAQQKTGIAVGEFAGKAAIGTTMAGGTVGAGLGGLVKKSIASNIPFVTKAFEEGGGKGALLDMAINTAIDMVTFGAGKAIPMIKKKILQEATTELSQEAIDKMAAKAWWEAVKRGEAAETISGKPADLSKVDRPGLPLLKDLTEAESRALSQPKAPKTIQIRKYAQQAKERAKNLDVKTTQALAGENASRAFKVIDNKRNSIGEEIRDIIGENYKAKADITTARAEFIKMAEDLLGGVFNAKGNLINAPGNVIADRVAAKEISDIYKELVQLPNDATLRSAVNLKRRARGLITQTPEGEYKKASNLMEGIVTALENNLNAATTAVAPGLAKANAEYTKYIKLTRSLSKALGKEINPESGLSKHGASIMKRSIESLADSGIGDIFRQVKEITNGDFDLIQDAVYASIAAKASGDMAQIRMALPFGGVNLVGSGGGGGDISKALSTISKSGVKKYKKGALDRIVDFAEKQQQLSKEAQAISALNIIRNEKGQIEVFHGSPHQFEKFKMSHIGEGEGVQAFGHGLYFTGEKDVAKFYAKNLSTYKTLLDGKPLSKKNPKYSAIMSIAANGQDAAEKNAKYALESGFVDKKAAQKELDDIISLKHANINQSTTGKLYKATIHKGKKAGEYDYIKWDEIVKPNTLKKVEKAITGLPSPQKQKIYDQVFAESDAEFIKSLREMDFDGNQLYNQLSGWLGGQKPASDILLKNGIDGIDYPAGSLSGMESKARNYVVFDENAVSINKAIDEAGNARLSGVLPVTAAAAGGILTAAGGIKAMSKRERDKKKKKKEPITKTKSLYQGRNY